MSTNLEPLRPENDAAIEAEAARLGILPEHRERVISELKTSGKILRDFYSGEPVSRDGKPMSVAIENYADTHPEIAPDRSPARLPGLARRVKTLEDLKLPNGKTDSHLLLAWYDTGHTVDEFESLCAVAQKRKSELAKVQREEEQQAKAKAGKRKEVVVLNQRNGYQG